MAKVRIIFDLPTYFDIEIFCYERTELFFRRELANCVCFECVIVTVCLKWKVFSFISDTFYCTSRQLTYFFDGQGQVGRKVRYYTSISTFYRRLYVK
jgi:uncharacterized membrane protein YwzB